MDWPKFFDSQLLTIIFPNHFVALVTVSLAFFKKFKVVFMECKHSNLLLKQSFVCVIVLYYNIKLLLISLQILIFTAPFFNDSKLRNNLSSF